MSSPTPAVEASLGASAGANPPVAEHRPLIDLNALPPIGTDESLRAVLKKLSQLIQGEAYAGIVDGQRLTMVSAHQTNDRQEQTSINIEHAAREAATTPQAGFFAAPNQQSSMVLQNVREESEAQLVLSFGVTAHSVRVGFVLIVNDEAALKRSQLYSSLVEQLRLELALWTDIWHRCRVGQSTEVWMGQVRKIIRNRNYWMFAIAGLIACLAIPVPYWPKRECMIEPAFRRFLASPASGRVIDAKVRPGDIVAANQLLARIDDEPLRWELSKAEAEYQQALKKRDSALAARSGGEARLAELEKDRVGIQIQSIRKQLELLEIRSPIAGIVVEGDWVPTAGATVEQAATLFEIAPLDRIRIQTLLSSEDLGQITVGTPVTLHVDAAYGQKWAGAVERIDPRGHLEKDHVVFNAETEVENDEGLLRPGMRGSVRLSPGARSLAWIVLNRPYTWLMKKFAW